MPPRQPSAVAGRRGGPRVAKQPGGGDGGGATARHHNQLVALCVPLHSSPDDLHRAFGRYGVVQSLRCVREQGTSDTKKVYLAYEKPIRCVRRAGVYAQTSVRPARPSVCSIYREYEWCAV